MMQQEKTAMSAGPMNAEHLLSAYEKIADAPDAIARLRRFLLDLAVRGKLVPQDANDEPAKGFRKSADPTAPFELPNNWKWAEIGDQLDLLNGMAFKPTDWATAGLRIVRIQNLNNPAAPFNFCDPEMARERSLIDNGSFLISWSGTPGTSFGAFIWDRGPAVLNQHIFRCDFRTKAFIAAFLRLAINGRLDEMIAKAHGGVGLQHITKGKLEALLIPLPPLAEQHRIVAKVDELMGLCDRLEAARAGREATRDRLAAASLARLNAPDPETFEADACFALDALPALTTRPDQIRLLRQTILNLAVRGKLVSQDSNDEPASELLKRIAKEKARRVKDREIRQRDIQPPIPSNEAPFDLPNSWVWTRLGTLCFLITDGAHHTPKYQDEGVPFLSVKDVSSGIIDFSNTRFISKEAHRELAKRCNPEFGDILLTKVGTTGIAVEVDTEQEFSIFVSLALLKFSRENIDRRFLCYLINSPFVKRQSADNTQGIGNKNLVLRLINQFAIPLPPLAEQHRIVAKVDALMALCDRLEASLDQTAAARRRLLDALLSEALAPAEAREMEAAE